MYTITIQDSVKRLKEKKPLIDPITGQQSVEYKYKKNIVVQAEQQAMVAAKTAEVQAKVDAYVAAQEAQGVGNPGPTAEFEIMKIVNEHNGDFEVVLEE